MKEDDSSDFFNSDDTLANIFVEDVIEPSSDFTEDQTAMGGHVTLVLQFRVMCQEYYYGPNCTTFCQPQDGPSGHNTCSENGTVECLPGYQNPASNCIDGKTTYICTRIKGALSQFCILCDRYYTYTKV